MRKKAYNLVGRDVKILNLGAVTPKIRDNTFPPPPMSQGFQQYSYPQSESYTW